MDHAFKSNLGWDRKMDTRQHLELDLELDLDDILITLDVEQELARNEEAIRRRIFTTLIQNVFPQVLQSTGVDSSLPEGALSTKSSNNLRNSFQLTGTDTVGIQNSMKMKIDVTSDKKLTGAQAFYAERGGIADAIARNILYSLKEKFFGIKSDDTRVEWDISGNSVKDYKIVPKKSA